MPTTTYSYPVSGTVAPTILQALGCNMLTAQVNMVDADSTGAVITHNWQLSTAQLSNQWPVVTLVYRGWVHRGSGIDGGLDQFDRGHGDQVLVIGDRRALTRSSCSGLSPSLPRGDGRRRKETRNNPWPLYPK